MDRIKYIDALRGFTMLLVVFFHTESYGMNLSGTLIGDIFLAFRMPLFFFVSGFVGFKAFHRWNKDFYRESLLKKAFVQLIPTIVFLILYTSLHGGNTWDYFKNFGFGFYWFTYVLFLIFLIYYTVCLLFKGFGDRAINAAMIGISVVFCAGMAFEKHSHFMLISNLPNLMWYFQFFTLGMLVRQYNEKALSIFRNDAFITICTILFVAGLYIVWDHRFLTPETPIWKFINYIAMRYLGLCVVFSAFVRMEEFFKKETMFTRALCFTGTRTLDIYMLHWFFIPSLAMISPLFYGSKNTTLEIIVVGGISVAIIALCILTSQLIRNSRFLGHFLFGAKHPNFKY